MKTTSKMVTTLFIGAVGFAVMFFTPQVFADCTSPTGLDGDMQWNSGSSRMQYCAGTAWQSTADVNTAVGCSSVGKITYRSSEIDYCIGNAGTWYTTAPATTYGSCAAGLAGKYYYDSTLHYYWFCNGTAWRRMAGCVVTKTAFTYTGSNQSYVVPLGCSTLTIKLWGAGGGGSAGAGGGAAYVTATIPVVGGETLTLVVGQGGVGYNSFATAAGAPATYGGGGAGGAANAYATYIPGSSGGGRSAVLRSAEELLTAGGGGAGGTYSGNPVIGGPGGGLASASTPYCAGANGSASTGLSGGAGGNTCYGSAGGAGSAGTGGAGGAHAGAYYGGGGGGGGYYGGGGGGAIGAGAGGLSFAIGAATSVTKTKGSTSTVANAGDGDYSAGIGAGGAANTSGGNGRIVIMSGAP